MRLSAWRQCARIQFLHGRICAIRSRSRCFELRPNCGRGADMPSIEGRCHPGFERVREAFAENFEKRDDVGAAVAVTVDGHSVVDLWGGFADKARTRPW